jgi:hypothetical protein
MSPVVWFLIGFLTCALTMVAALGTLYWRDADEDTTPEVPAHIGQRIKLVSEDGTPLAVVGLHSMTQELGNGTLVEFRSLDHFMFGVKMNEEEQ